MNAQMNNSNEKRGGSSIIPDGDTTKYATDMFIQQRREEALKRFAPQIRALQANPLAPDAYKPHKLYLAYLQEKRAKQCEDVPTQLLRPSRQDTENIRLTEIAAAQTVHGWSNFAEDMGLVRSEIECSPVTERVPRITKQLSVPRQPLNEQSDHNYYASSALGLISLISTGVELYRRERDCDPKHIEISATAYQLLELFVSWEHGFPGQSGPIPIKGNPHLSTHAVTCWNIE